MTTGLDNVVAFHESYIAYRKGWQCSPSKQLDTAIVNDWYTYRPILEERRTGYWGTAYSADLQVYAEAIQPPLYRSEVQKDPRTKLTQLRYPDPVRKIDR